LKEKTMKKIKLLLVDDEENFVNTLSERLKMRDVPAKVVYSGEEALEVVRTQEPDVMVLDLRMPGIDGMEVLRKVKATNPDIQVIILTGHGTELDEEEARKLGAFHYHKKPIDIDELLGTVKKAYRQRIEDAMVAAAMAEGGDFEEARRIMDEDK
jgi:DNA-binding NtrC family response regulator